jgi:hypothetical protein
MRHAERVTDGQPNRFKMSLEDLERTAHVPLEDQVEGQPEPVSSEPIDSDWNQQQRTIRWAGG